MSEAQSEYAAEVLAIESKPVLESLCDDLRSVADALPVGSTRRIALESLLVAFSRVLRSPRHHDLTPADADAFRNGHNIPKRCT